MISIYLRSLREARYKEGSVVPNVQSREWVLWQCGDLGDD